MIADIEPADIEPSETGRKKWTRDEYRQLMEIGILEEARFELIGGDIVPKMTQHERHIYTCKQVQKALEAIFGIDYVRLAAPIAIGEYEEPEPDAAVMHRPLVDYLRLGTPLPAEVRLAVEVSDRTLRQDLNAKKKSNMAGQAFLNTGSSISMPARCMSSASHQKMATRRKSFCRPRMWLACLPPRTSQLPSPTCCPRRHAVHGSFLGYKQENAPAPANTLRT